MKGGEGMLRKMDRLAEEAGAGSRTGQRRERVR